MRAKLTEKIIAGTKIPPGKTRVKVWDGQVTGFGAIVGRRDVALVAEARVNGKPKRVSFGKLGKPMPGGGVWTVAKARIEAIQLIGSMLSGSVPVQERRSSRGPTLRDGLELHIQNMERKDRAPRSIATMRSEVERILADWLDRPIADLTGDKLDKEWSRIKKEARPKRGVVNEPGLAQANRTVAHVSAIWNSLDKKHDLPGRNPATRVVRGALKPQVSRIGDGKFPDWLEVVRSLSPVRRDLQLFTLVTGVRSLGVRSIQWTDIKGELLHVRIAKGDKPYSVPLSTVAIHVLRRRRIENAIEFVDHGGDHGWVFPSLSRAKPYRVIHVAEPRESKPDKAGKSIAILPGLHALRRTHNSVAMEIGIFQEHREALLNHNGKGVNVKSYGRPQNWTLLAKHQEAISQAMLERFGVSDIYSTR